MSEAAMTIAGELRKLNDRLIAAMRNHLPALLDALDAAQERERGLTEVLELIEVDLDAGDIAPKTRVKLALSRVRAALGDPNASHEG